jgi:type IV secretion system protein TrbL
MRASILIVALHHVSFFENFVQIVVLMIARAIVVISFFILAVQLFITLIEFKLTTLAGFVLVPFGLFNKTSFLAEKVLGNVVASGIKILVLAVIIGIGTSLFSQFTQGFGGNQPTIQDALSLVHCRFSASASSVPALRRGLFREHHIWVLARRSARGSRLLASVRRA